MIEFSIQKSAFFGGYDSFIHPPSHAVFPSPAQGTKRQLKVELLGAVKSRGLDTLSKNLNPNSKTLNPKQKHICMDAMS